MVKHSCGKPQGPLVGIKLTNVFHHSMKDQLLYFTFYSINPKDIAIVTFNGIILVLWVNYNWTSFWNSQTVFHGWWNQRNVFSCRRCQWNVIFCQLSQRNVLYREWSQQNVLHYYRSNRNVIHCKRSQPQKNKWQADFQPFPKKVHYTANRATEIYFTSNRASQYYCIVNGAIDMYFVSNGANKMC